jgi:hypothetical protein
MLAHSGVNALVAGLLAEEVAKLDAASLSGNGLSHLPIGSD